MLHSVDIFRHPSQRIRIGQTCRFPLHTGAFGRTKPYSDELDDVYPYTWEVVAFGLARHAWQAAPFHTIREAGLCLVRRRHDGVTKWVSDHWVRVYAVDDVRAIARPAALRKAA